MFSFKRYILGIGLGLFGCAVASAAPPLTTVQDILFNADGTRFNGVATISWQSFEASDMSNVPAHSISTQIVNGLLRVQLVPTTNALSPASYNVVYNSDGSTQFQESWGVPPSSVAVRVRDIRIGGPGTTVGGGNNPPPVLNSVNISDVIGLVSALNLRATIGTGYTPSRTAVIDAAGALDGAIGTATDCVHVDGSSGPCGAGTGTTGSTVVFVDGEIPTGTANGANPAFQLGNAPSPAASLALFRNGLRLKQGTDYTLNGGAITFAALAVPQGTDILLASYRLGGLTGLTFVDAEVPTGTVDGSNAVFTISQTPSPATSLSLFRNGLRLRANLDYTLNGTTLIFLSGLAPQPGDVLIVSYRLGAIQLN